MSRPYPVLSTASHPHSEVKPLRARIVRMWGTRSEVRVLRFFFLLFLFLSFALSFFWTFSASILRHSNDLFCFLDVLFSTLLLDAVFGRILSAAKTFANAVEITTRRVVSSKTDFPASCCAL